MKRTRTWTLALIVVLAGALLVAEPSSARPQPALKRATLIQKDGPPRLRFRATNTSRQSQVFVVGDGQKGMRARRLDANHWLLQASSRRTRTYLRALVKNLNRVGHVSVLAAIEEGSAPTPITFFTVKALNEPTSPE